MEAFENAYEGTPSWEIGRPQPAVVRLAEAGSITGYVLDAGCGTGETALYLAARGCRVLGVDFSRRAIERARAKLAAAHEAQSTGRRIEVDFAVADVRDLAGVGPGFDVALDVGCFHTLQPHDRQRYADALAGVLRSGGHAFVLCWSDRNPFGIGPERIRRRDLRGAFGPSWSVASIEEERLETRLPCGSVHAWLARLVRP